MFFEISKFLNLFISPITWIVALIVLYFLNRDKRVWHRVILVATILLFLVSTNMILVDYVRYKCVERHNLATIEVGKRYDVAIVMGGFSSMNRETGAIIFEQDRADRLWEAVRLYKQGIVDNILITGDSATRIQDDGSTTAQLFLDYMELLSVPSETFILEQHALNTRQNAHYTAQILRQRNIEAEKAILITSITHIKRSLDCFAAEGYELDYLPSNSYSLPQNITHRSFYPDWRAAIKWQLLINEWIGNLVYEIVGYKSRNNM